MTNISNIVPVEDNSSSTPVLEKTFVILKPDASERGLVAEIINRFVRAGFSMTKVEVKPANHQIISEHYKHISNKPFFPTILNYMMRGNLVLIEFEGIDAINGVRKLVGATNPVNAEPGTIRGDLGLPPSGDDMENLVHCSDSQEAYKFESELWFNFKVK